MNYAQPRAEIMRELNALERMARADRRNAKNPGWKQHWDGYLHALNLARSTVNRVLPPTLPHPPT